MSVMGDHDRINEVQAEVTGLAASGSATGSHDDPQSRRWAGLAWSPWHDFDAAHQKKLIPATPGLYRFRAPGIPGLLYIGESGARGGRAARLAALARGRCRHSPDYYLNWRANGIAKRPHRGHYAAPYIRQAEEATGRTVEISWTRDEHPDDTQRKAAEARLLAMYRHATGGDPPVQNGGRGMAEWLSQRKRRE
jgi:hypothetical protein